VQSAILGLTLARRNQYTLPDHVNVLLVGGGGREHALARAIKSSKRCGKLFATHTDNAGIAQYARPVNFPFSVKEAYRAIQFCEKNKIGLIVVGPEVPLAQGAVDELTDNTGDVPRIVFGPVKAGAMLEADKAWAKQLMRSASIPTAEGRSFYEPANALSYLESREEMPVIKATGLAAGKGVFLPDSLDEAKLIIDAVMVRRELGDAGKTVILEERMTGPEVSVFAITDGRNIAILDTAQDHKRLLDGDRGPNTGGMGSYSPAPMIDAKLMDTIQREIIIPTIDAMRREGIEYRGILYAGIMLTPAGPKVLEFNVRFGDPECQTLMARLKGDALALLHATASGHLDLADFEWDPRPACTVVLASDGYPGEYQKGLPITGIDEAQAIADITVDFAGVSQKNDGTLVTSGGRVLAVTALGSTIDEARTKAYEGAAKIHFDGMRMRRDIAHQAVKAGV